LSSLLHTNLPKFLISGCDPMFKSAIFLSALALGQGFTIAPTSHITSPTSTALLLSQQSNEIESRREFFTASSAVLGLMALIVAAPEEALASGGATAGKYTTIPIAKR